MSSVFHPLAILNCTAGIEIRVREREKVFRVYQIIGWIIFLFRCRLPPSFPHPNPTRSVEQAR